MVHARDKVGRAVAERAGRGGVAQTGRREYRGKEETGADHGRAERENDGGVKVAEINEYALAALKAGTAVAVPTEKKQENARYIAHTVKVNSLKKIDKASAQEIRQRTIDYLQLCVDDGIKPNLTGYALALGTNRQGLERIFTNRTVEQGTLDELDRGVAMIENVMLELMMDQKINPVTAIFLLKTQFNYREESTLNIRAERSEQVDEEALRERYMTVIDAEVEDAEPDKGAIAALRDDIQKHIGESR